MFPRGLIIVILGLHIAILGLPRNLIVAIPGLLGLHIGLSGGAESSQIYTVAYRLACLEELNPRIFTR